MEFNASGDQVPAVDHDHRIAKVRPEAVRPRAPMHDLDRTAVGKRERTSEQSIVPGGREVSFYGVRAISHASSNWSPTVSLRSLAQILVLQFPGRPEHIVPNGQLP